MTEKPIKYRIGLALFKLRMRVALRLLPREAFFLISPDKSENTKADKLYFILSSIGGEDFVDQILAGKFDYSECSRPKVSEARRWMM